MRKYTWMMTVLILVGCSDSERGPAEEAANLFADAFGASASEEDQRKTAGEPTDAAGYRQRAEALFRAGDFEGSLAAYTRALELGPDARLYFSRGLVLNAVGRSEPAIADFTEAIRREPSSALAHFHRALAYTKLTNAPVAVRDLTEAIRLDPLHAESHQLRGALRLGMGELESASLDLSKAIELDPKNVEARVNRGHVHCLQGQYDLAIADLDEALRLQPRNPVAHNHRGNAYSKKWRQGMVPRVLVRVGGQSRFNPELFQRALSDFNEAVRLDPRDYHAHSNRGALHAQQGEHVRAIADFTRAIELQSDYAPAYRNRGHCYLEQGNTTRAQADFHEALRLEPGNADLVPASFRR